MSFRRFRRPGVLAVMAVLALTACGSEPDPDPAGADEATVAVRSFMFDPATVRVNAGTTVIWTNEDDIPHTVTSGSPGEGGVPGVSEETAPEADGLFDEALDGAATSASFTFDEAGTFTYFCSIHDGMTGAIEVS